MRYDMEHRIKKDTTLKEAAKILGLHGCLLDYGLGLVLGMLLQGCDYLEVHGFGSKVYFSKMAGENLDENRKEGIKSEDAVKMGPS